MKLSRLFTWLPGLLALAAVLATAIPPGPIRGFDLDRFGRTPVLEGGRIKPLDSVARNALLMIRGKQSVPVQGRTLGPDEWVLDVLFRPQEADAQPLFVINDPDVLGLMGLKQGSNRYFSFTAIAPHLQEIGDQARAAQALEAVQRSRFQNAVVNLYDRLLLYNQLENSIQLADSPGLFAELQALRDPQAAERHRSLAEAAHFRILPPLPGQSPDAWKNVGEALDAAASGSLNPALVPLAVVGGAYAANDPASFNRAVGELQALTGTIRPEALKRANSEILFNRVQPFYLGMVIYVLALLTLFASWLVRRELLQPAAFSLLAAGALVHTVGLASRILLQGRPPVTNLYSSAIFVGWAAVILGLFTSISDFSLYQVVSLFTDWVS